MSPMAPLTATALKETTAGDGSIPPLSAFRSGMVRVVYARAIETRLRGMVISRADKF